MITLWEKATGKSRQCEPVDAREILEHSPDIYTDKPPKGAKVKAEAAEPADENDLTSKTVKELHAIAEDRGIDLGKAKTKAAMIALIEAAEPADENAEE